MRACMHARMCLCLRQRLARCPSAFQENYLLKVEHAELGQVICLPGQ